MKQGWEKKRLGEVIILEYGKPLPNEKRIVDGKYPVYGANGLKGRSNEFYYNKRTIVVGRKGSAGEINLTEEKFWPLDVTYYVTFDETKYEVLFLFHLLSLLGLPKLAKGVKPGINRNEVYELDVNIPPLPEQQRMVSILDEAFAAIAKAKAITEQNLKNAKELFESYLQGVFEKKGDGWEEKTLGDVYDVRDGTHDSPKYQNLGFALVTSKNLKNHKLVFDDIKFISEIDYISINKRSKVNVGDVLFAMIGTIGNPVVITDEPNYAIKNVALFKVGSEQNSYFLKYFLDSKQTIEKMLCDAKGTTQKFVGLGYLRNFPILVPPLKEQKAIVHQLDALRAETQKLEAVYQKKIADLEELKKSFLQKAFAGELETGKEIAV